MKKLEKSDAVSEVEHRHGNSVASLQYAHVNKSITYNTMHKRKTPINMLSRGEAPKTQQNMGYKNKRQTSEVFCWY